MNAPTSYDSVLLSLGFHPEPSVYGTRYIVPDGDFGFNIALQFPSDKAVQIVTAFLALPKMSVVDANPKWDVKPEEIARLVPDLYRWATEERKRGVRPGPEPAQ